MTDRENRLRAARFEKPESIPLTFNVNKACWHAYPQEALCDLMEGHPRLFPDFVRPSLPFKPDIAPWRRAGIPYTDSWGCVWKTTEDGITGAVVDNPLSNWEAFADYASPDPDEHDGWGPIDWKQKQARIRAARQNGQLATGSLRHGHTFLTLTYIRGYENTLLDMADGDVRMQKLLAMIEAFNAGLVERYLKIGVEWFDYPEDLGMQCGPMVSPRLFREYIKPVYKRLFEPARKSGCVIYMHSDGDIRALCDDLFDAGIQVVNLQDQVNGVEWIRDQLKGRVCIDLDIDRQSITRFGTPRQIDAHIRRVVEELGQPRGGLMLKHGLYPGVPLANVKALMDAMERYAG